MPDTETLIAGAIIAVVMAVPLALLFGFTRRTLLVALALAIGAGVFYPGGTIGLVVDTLRPVRAFFQGQKDRAAGRDAAVGEAAEGHAPTGGR